MFWQVGWFCREWLSIPLTQGCTFHSTLYNEQGWQIYLKWILEHNAESGKTNRPILSGTAGPSTLRSQGTTNYVVARTVSWEKILVLNRKHAYRRYSNGAQYRNKGIKFSPYPLSDSRAFLRPPRLSDRLWSFDPLFKDLARRLGGLPFSLARHSLPPAGVRSGNRRHWFFPLVPYENELRLTDPGCICEL